MLPAVPAAAADAVPVASVVAAATAAAGDAAAHVATPAGCLTAVRRGMDGGGMDAGPPGEALACCPAAAMLTLVGTEHGFGIAWLSLMSVAPAAWCPAFAGAPAAQAGWSGTVFTSQEQHHMWSPCNADH